MTGNLRQPTLIEALIPIIFLVVLLSYNVIFVFKTDSLDGSNQIILLLSAAVAAVIGLRMGRNWKQIQDGMVKSIGSAMASILILLLIGSLAGTWLLSGIVPSMVYYGLKILNPTIFLFAACVVCSIVSLATGSSWSTIATVGIALLGIGARHAPGRQRAAAGPGNGPADHEIDGDENHRQDDQGAGLDHDDEIEPGIP